MITFGTTHVGKWIFNVGHGSLIDLIK
jgi:hypothetical protein